MAVNWRKIFTSPYSDKTHFIYELIQNADDSKSKHLEMQLRENELIVWNDGRQFTKKDVDSICSIGFSNKDLTQIGTFGMGITAVFTYTDCLEVYSGDRYFRIKIEDPTKRENIDLDEIDSTITEQLKKGRTVFRLPFRKKLRQEDIEKLRDRLCNLAERRPLLFLRHLERIVWRNELGAQIGSYFCYRCPHDKMQDASEVGLTTFLDDNNQQTETFLVFNKKVQPPPDVIDELLYQAEDDTEQQRIQQSVKKPQPIEIAFRLQDSRITVMADRCMLFSYLSTQKETHLRFIIQARYQTTLARENIEDIEDNLWNRWLVRETANFLPEVLEQLKSGGLLEPAFFDVLPLKKELEKAFKPIVKTLRKAMRERLLVPTQDGAYTKAENVLYPHDELLREFIESSWLHPNSSWLHPDIQDREEFRRRFTFMQDSGVNIIGFRRMLRWLEEQDSGWFESKSNERLRCLYAYLNKHQSELERIKKLPLIRLENGRHVCASNELVFFPPNTDEERKKIEPFLSNVPILQATLLEGEERNEIEVFLRKSLEVKTLRPVNLILKGICPQYRRFPKPSVEENRLHVRYLFEVWNDLSEFERNRLEGQISEIPILRAYKGIECKTYDFVKPGDAYLPKAYTGDDNLETYFSVYNGAIWFVDHIYLEDDSEQKDWLQFLKAIGFMDTPRSIKKTIRAKSGDDQEFSKELNERDIKPEHTTQWHTHWSKTSIEDFYLEGLSEILTEISEHKKINLSQVLWCLLVKVLLSEPKRRDAFFKGTYHWSYYGSSSEDFDAMFCRQLKEFAWLPDEQGNFHRPSKCFAPTDDNRRVLGDSVAYLHPDFDVSQDNETARWLAEKLGIHLNANTDSVLNYLQTLSGTEASVEKVEPLYRFLARQDARPREEFKQKSLIFTANPEPRWWKADEVFWKNESPVFGNHRGYLKGNYAAYEGTLKPFFNALGVLDQASQLDYARGIQEITTTEQAKEEEVRSRVRRLYRSLTWLQADQWKIIYDSRCWLGKKGSEWEFFSRNELVWDDHRYIADIFEGEVPFWTFDDLLELTKYLKIEGCSQAKVKFHPEGEKEKDTDLSMMVRNLRPYIHAFLNSPRLCEAPAEGKSADVLNSLSVCFVEELKTTYTLKEISLTSPNPRPSFLEVTNEEVTLWLALAADKDDYALLIGDALQDYFGVKDLGRFTEHLFTKKDRDKVLDNWKREGLRTELCVSLPQTDAKEGEKKRSEYIDQGLPDGADAEIPITNKTPEIGDEDNDLVTDKSEIHPASDEGNDSRTDEPEIETPTDGETTDIDKSNDSSTANEPESPTNPVSDIQGISSRNTQSLTKADSDVTQSVKGEPESETPTVHEDPETGNKNDDSTENKSETTSYQPRPGGSRTRPRGRKGINTPSGNRGTSHSSGRSDGTEDNTHMEETGTSPQARKEIERIGMEHARRYEEEQGYTVEDVSTENLGYDLRSTTPNGEIRCIEVKARTERGLVVLTSNEWHTAEQLKDDYFLYVVLNARTQPEFYIIRNPTNVVSPIQDIRYQVPLSEITEHGIRV